MNSSEENKRSKGASARGQDSMGDRNNVDNTTERPSGEHGIQAASEISTDSTNEWTDVWPRWGSRLKDVIGLTIIGVGVAVGWLTLQSIEKQVETSVKQTEALKKQVETAVKQTEAVWYSTRPVLTMKSIEPQKDILPWSNPVRTPNGIITDSSLFNSLTITIQNVGQTPAALDTVFYELIGNNQLRSDFTEISTVVTPDQNITDQLPSVLRSDAVNYLRIHFRYHWEQREISAQPLIFQREYALAFENSAWKVGLFQSDKFDSLMGYAKSISSSR